MSEQWADYRIVVAGLGRAGFAAADALVEAGAYVIAVDESQSEITKQRAELLEFLGAETRLGVGAAESLPDDVNVVVASPGWHPDSSIFAQARQRGIEIWGDVEVAWRLMHPDRVVPWIGITGTNGKTTTSQMLTAMLEADGLTVATVGNIGRPIIEAINDEIDYDVFVVELSSFQLHWVSSMQLHSALVLNVAPDHLEWYASYGDEAYAQYCADKAKIYHGVEHFCVYYTGQPELEEMVVAADVVEGARAIGVTAGVPAISQVGYVDELLVDRAFIPQRRDSALPLADSATFAATQPHNLVNAAAAAALARGFGATPGAIAQALGTLQLDAHRVQTVATHEGITWVDDSKATNPHAVDAAMGAYESIVWIAGGQAKGTSFDELITTHAHRLAGVVLLGIDKHQIAESLSQHAPEVTVKIIEGDQTSVMADVVDAAAELARPGDVVLLSPGCASRDMWPGYEQRGDDFTAYVKARIETGR